MKKHFKKLFFVTVFVSSVFTFSQGAIVNIDDGAYHLINDNTYQSDTVILDETIANTPGTRVSLVNGGLVYDLAAYHNATITMYGGSVERYLVGKDNGTITMSGGSVLSGLMADGNATVTLSGGEIDGHFNVWDNVSIIMSGGSVVSLIDINDNATITMSGGSVGGSFLSSDSSITTISEGSIGDELVAYNNATINMSGGSVGDDLYAHRTSTVNMYGGAVLDSLFADENATVNMTGGTVENFLYTYDNASIYLDGTGFQITDLDGNITSLSYGDKLSDLGTLVEYTYTYNPENPIPYYYSTGTITGMLSDGSVLNNTFEIYNTGPYSGTADIHIIPEPATLILFGLGGMMLRRRKSA